MKKVYLLFICLVFISSCNDDLVMERNDILSTKLLQKSGIRKNEVIELIYRGFI